MDDGGPLTNTYPSHDFPMQKQIANTPCEWCGESLGQNPHGMGSSCMEGHCARSDAEIIGGHLQFVADVLRRKACTFGVEPLQDSLDRLRMSVGQLERLLDKRIKS